MLLTLMAVSCTTQTQHQQNKEPLKVPVKTILILPVTSQTQNIGNDAALIEQLIDKALTREGYQVIIPDAQRFQKLYDAALIDSGSIYNPNTQAFLPLDRSIYMRYMIDNLKDYYEHDALIDPEVLLRPAKVVGDNAVWDGLKTEVEVRNAPRSGHRLPPLAKGISLRLATYTRNGGGINLAFAGVSLPYVVYFNGDSADFELKKTYFTQKEIEDSVKRALQPLLQKIEVSHEP